MKRIYLILTHTGTIPSKVIRRYTKAPFSHVSISLDEDLNQMYSFGRLNPYNFIIAGFVHEGINFGTFKRFKETETNIYSLEIEDKQYEKIKTIIYDMEHSGIRYKFNNIGLIAVAFNKRVKRKNHFYCAEFLQYLFNEVGIENELPEIVRPEDFMKVDRIKLIYSGKLRDYVKRDGAF